MAKYQFSIPALEDLVAEAAALIGDARQVPPGLLTEKSGCCLRGSVLLMGCVPSHQRRNVSQCLWANCVAERLVIFTIFRRLISRYCAPSRGRIHGSPVSPCHFVMAEVLNGASRVRGTAGSTSGPGTGIGRSRYTEYCRSEKQLPESTHNAPVFLSRAIAGTAEGKHTLRRAV